jgi:hypothetical protein
MDAATLARAYLGSCQLFGLGIEEQAALLYLSVEAYTTGVIGTRRLDPESIPGRRAQLILRLHTRLDALADRVAVRRWYRAYSESVDGVPAELARGLDGLGILVKHVEQMAELSV